MKKNYLKLEDLEVYQISRELSKMSWEIFKRLDSEQRYIFGKQFITAADSIGANIAEGYGRFHYLDKVKFYYNARASLYEVRHWNDLLKERDIISDEEHNVLKEKLDLLNLKLNSYIKSNLNKKFNP